MYTYTYMYMYMCIYTYIYIYTYIHREINICKYMLTPGGTTCGITMIQ